MSWLYYNLWLTKMIYIHLSINKILVLIGRITYLSLLSVKYNCFPFFEVSGINIGLNSSVQWCLVFIHIYIAYHHLNCEFESRSWQDVLDTTLCDKVCLLLAAGRWFSPGTPVSFTNKTDRHDITEILLQVTLNTITLTLCTYSHRILDTKRSNTKVRVRN